MSEILYDRIRVWEDRAVVVLSGLGIVTRRDIGFSAEVPAGGNQGTPWVDISIVRASSEEQQGQAQTVTILTVVRVVVVATEWPRAFDLADWTLDLADVRLRADSELRQLFAKIQSTNTQRTMSKADANPEVEVEFRIRSEIQYQQPQGDITGLIVTLDAQDFEGGENRGHARQVYVPRLVTFSTRTPQIAPHAPTALYANAEAGDVIRVLDAADDEIATAPIVSLPANDIVLPLLPTGVYTLEMSGVRSLHTLTISEAPS